MAKLTRAQRAKLPSSAFACPSIRAYPLDTIGRVVNARTRTKTFGEKCRGQKAKICARARRFGLLNPKYKGYRGWVDFCRRR